MNARVTAFLTWAAIYHVIVFFPYITAIGQSCYHLWTENGIRTSGDYEIDTDGPKGPLAPFTVLCNMGDGTDVDQVVTVVQHDTQNKTHVKDHELPGSYVRNISYNGTSEEQLVSLIELSNTCEQYIQWECKGAMFGFWYYTGVDSWWVGRNWTAQYFWGGAATDSHACGCHPHCASTVRNSTCNCDANDKTRYWIDDGLILDKSRLPILQLRFGDTGNPNENGFHTVGPLKCRNVTHKEFFQGNFTAPVTFTSPYFNSGYPPPFHKYHWDVTVLEGDFIEVAFSNYDVLYWGAYRAVPGCDDVVQLNVKGANDINSTLFGKQKHSPPYYVTDGSQTLIRLTFVTCHQKDEVQEKGFQVDFRRKECPGCKVGMGDDFNTTECSGGCGIIASYRYPFPEYVKRNRLYKHFWKLTVSPGKIIALHFNDLDLLVPKGLSNCSRDSGILQIYNGDREDFSQLIGGYCNYNKESVVYSNGNMMFLYYSAYLKVVGSGRGFHATFKEVNVTEAPPKVNISALENVALGKPATQSSTLEIYSADLAVDGIESINFAHGSCMSTNAEEGPWWRVDLQSRHQIYGVAIYNREAMSKSSLKHVGSWPRGYYGLAMPTSGCPSSLNFEWEMGKRFQHLVYSLFYDSTEQHWHPNLRLQGGYKKEDGAGLRKVSGVETNFCLKNVDSTVGDSEWMPGQYCIFQVDNECPNEFSSGFITWIDHRENNQNWHSGSLPKGEYTNYTKIFFCCRNDGNAYIPIDLPTDRPFYLFPYKKDCQTVNGMSLTKHFLHFQEDKDKAILQDSDLILFQEPHPYIETQRFEGDITMFYCYYDIYQSLRGFRVVVDEHGLISTFNIKHFDNGIAHQWEEPFEQSFMCFEYSVTEQPFSVLHRNCTQPVIGQYVTIYIAGGRHDIMQLCEVKVFGRPLCGQPLGMASEEIYDNQITATSFVDVDRHYMMGRLNQRNGWCAMVEDSKKYLQIDLQIATTITGVILQGLNRANKNTYTEQFFLTFSNDNDTWRYEEEPVGRQKLYICHQCQHSQFNNDLPVRFNLLNPFLARFVRITMIDYVTMPCLRLEIIGCEPEEKCSRNSIQVPGNVTSPYFPNYYGQKRSCWYTIEPPTRRHVELRFLMFDIAEKELSSRAGICTDKVTLYSGTSSNLRKIRESMGKSIPPKIISQGSLTIHLQSCFRYTISRNQGFYAEFNFTDCPGCGMGVEVCEIPHYCNAPCGYIASVNYPYLYSSNHRCRWLIQAPIDHYINVTIKDFDIIGDDSCLTDYLDFYDGTKNYKEDLIGRYCNAHKPPYHLTSRWNVLLIEFLTDSGASGKGFMLEYHTIRVDLPEKLKKAVSNVSELCDEKWIRYQNNCYILFNESNNTRWDDAEKSCQTHQGHLVSIMDRDEMEFVHYLLTGVWQVFRRKIHIGLTDRHNEGMFRWTDNNPMCYTDWHRSVGKVQPNGGQYEDCTVIALDNLHSTSHWHDIPCSLGGIPMYMCKKPIKGQALSFDTVISLNSTFNQTFAVLSNEGLYSQIQPFLDDVPSMPFQFFQCQDKEYILPIRRCDGKIDCRDGSDEDDCGSYWTENSFTCEKDGTDISMMMYCDFVENCPDGSDEKNCVHRNCTEEEYRCNNGQCIDPMKRCDLIPHCVDKSDENNCGGICQPSVTFQCYDGTCIPMHAVCDGNFDCAGVYHEDEKQGCQTDDDRQAIKVDRMLCSSHIRRTCDEMFQLDEVNVSGYYVIDPDGTDDDTIMPFRVYCEFNISSESGVTIVHHDSEHRMYVRSTLEGPATYNRNISYDDVTIRQLVGLIEASAHCRQYLKWECSGAEFRFDERPFSWWVSRKGEPQYYWGGTTRNQTCACYPHCIDATLPCNCDINKRFYWTQDEGYATDSSKLPLKQVWFGDVYEPGEAGYHTIGPLECFGAPGAENQENVSCSISSQWLKCKNGHYVKKSFRCLYALNHFGYLIGCRDLTHLWNCENFDCPADYVKCPKSYCIPVKLICNGLWDCPGGYDEINCANFHCPSMYQCHNYTACIPLHQVCDGDRQCPSGDDELMCEISCPEQCQCNGLFASCANQSLNVLPEDIVDIARIIDFSNNRINLSLVDFRFFTYLGELNLTYNGITVLIPGSFDNLTNLYKLDLSHNNIIRIEYEAFKGLPNLRVLYLEGNPLLSVIEPGSFKGLDSLPYLNLRHHKIHHLKAGTFEGLKSVRVLNLTNNNLEIIDGGAFRGLIKTVTLDIRGHDIRKFNGEMLLGMKSLTFLYSDSYKFCCLAYPQIPANNCLPEADEFSSCDDLMSNSVLRTFLWVLGTVAFCGNLFVIIWRGRCRDLNRVNSSLILSLGCADFLMGIYLLIIASVDLHYRGIYIENSDDWRESSLCQFCGFLSTLSTEVSVFTLTLITFDRLIAIALYFRISRISRQESLLFIGISWTLACFLAVLPFMHVTYFKGKFYARSGVCLALHITDERPSGWEYAVGIFLVLNFIAFLFIIFSYIYMYASISKSNKNMTRMMAHKSKDVKVGRQMAIIVLTNFTCWMPIIIMGMLALNGKTLPDQVYAWTAVFILPLNSSINPLLYTISSIEFSKYVHSILDRHRQSMLPSSVPSNATALHSSIRKPVHSQILRPPYGYSSLKKFLYSNKVQVKDLLNITRSICSQTQELHEDGYALGNLEMRAVFIHKTFRDDSMHIYIPIVNAIKTTNSISDSHTEDTAKDIHDIGNIVKKMLQLFHKQRTFSEANNVSDH